MDDLIYFLKSECPVRVLEEKITWGQFIGLSIQGFICFGLMYLGIILIVAIADFIEVFG